MDAKFLIRDYEIDIIPEIKYSDYMDGTPDTMAFSFKTDENLSEIINIKEKCEVQIWDIPRLKVGNTGWEIITVDGQDRNTLYLIIDDVKYTVGYEMISTDTYPNCYEIFDENENSVGLLVPSEAFNEKSIQLYDKGFYFTKQGFPTNKEVNIYKDNKLHYYMCVAQISSEKMSTNSEECGYMNTVRLKEQTILLKDCIRTDVAITPSLYPQITDGTNETNIYNTLLEAAYKVVDCHNMCSLNEPINFIDNDLQNALKQVACPNLTYRDLSTYSQLYDILIRVGRIPYFSNGTLYGLMLQGDLTADSSIDLSQFSQLSSLKEEGVNDNIYSSKVYNNIYDEEIAVVPQIFTDMAKYIYFTPKKVNGNNNSYTVLNDGRYYFIIDDVRYTIDEDLYGKPLKLNNVIEVNQSDFTFTIGDKTYQITGVFDSRNTSTNNSSSPVISKSEQIPYVSGQPDINSIKTFATRELEKWTLLNSQNENDISKTLLYVKGYDTAGQDIQDSRSYSLELPYAIERVEHIYSCEPWIEVEPHGTGNDAYSVVYVGWKLRRYDDNRIIENSMYEYLSELQKRTCCYYSRGKKSIHNIVCLNVTDDDDWSILDLSNEDVQGAFKWSGIKLYNELRSQFYVVEYKPILDTYYTNYDYYKEEENKPKSISNFNFPYSEVSDKQAYPVLEYNLEKGLDTSRDIKIITDNINILKIHAGDAVTYEDGKYLVNTISNYINNNTIECSLSLTNNVVQNSVLSYYTDNVRVSSILSAESVVNRPIHLFGENVVSLYDYNNLDNDNRDTEQTYFIEEVGQCLDKVGLFDLGIYQNPVSSGNEYNPYAEISKYPFRFDKIIDGDKTDYSPSAEYIIKLSTGNPAIDDVNYIEISNSDFPITVSTIAAKAISMMGVVITNINSVTVYNIQELENEIYNREYYLALNILSIPSWFFMMGIKKNGDSEYEILYPPLDLRGTYWTQKIAFWITNNYSYPKQNLHNYRLYKVGEEYNTTLYGTEKLVTTSGLITKYEFSFPNSSYATSTFRDTEIRYPENLNTYLSSHNGIYKENFDNADNKSNSDKSSVKIEYATPAYFNTTFNGCKLAGIGNKQEDFYSLYKLHHISPYAYYLDLRENPRPYIQYKTLFRGDDSIVPLQLNQNLEYMKCRIVKNNEVAGGTPMILKIPKFKNLSTFEVNNDNIDELLVTTCDSTQLMTSTKMAKYVLHNSISKLDNYDYVLCIRQGNISTGYNYINVFKFNIKDDKTVSTLCVDYKIYSEI